MQFHRIFAACLVAAVPAAAQRPSPNARGVEFGHIHLNSADPDSAMAFWKDVIGAAAYSHGNLNGVSLIGAIVLFTRSAPSGPSAGSAIDHIAFKVPDLQPFVEKLANASHKAVESAAGDRLTFDGPDGVRIELIEDTSMYAPLEFNHIHLHSPHPKDMQAWYAKNFGGRIGTGEDADSLQLRGVTLTFSQADSVAPTAGRAIDHLGLEVKDLAAFCKTLTDNGVKLDSAYRTDPQSGLGTAFLTDPWGTRIELTEGLMK